jgi:hypothetical protein
LVSVTVLALLVVLMTWLGKLMVPDGNNVTACTPEPVRVAVCGLFVALSVNVRVPVFTPSAEGVNVTLIKQLL